MKTSPARRSCSAAYPPTAYRYRFIAEGTGRRGNGDRSGGTPGVEGADAGSTPDASPQGPEPCPANEEFRAGASGALPDCRAYEMVSPVDKEGGEIRVLGETLTGLPAVLSQSCLRGKSSSTAPTAPSADAASAPFTSQYIAGRAGEDPEPGWHSNSISPPRTTQIVHAAERRSTPNSNTSAKTSATGWLRTFADPPLTPRRRSGFTEPLPAAELRRTEPMKR